MATVQQLQQQQQQPTTTTSTTSNDQSSIQPTSLQQQQYVQYHPLQQNININNLNHSSDNLLSRSSDSINIKLSNSSIGNSNEHYSKTSKTPRLSTSSQQLPSHDDIDFDCIKLQLERKRVCLEKKLSMSAKTVACYVNNIMSSFYSLRQWPLIRQTLVVFQVCLLCYLLSGAIIKFQMLDNKSTLVDFSNNECAKGAANDACLTNPTQQFDRVLFFYNDGLARDLVDDLLSTFSDHANTFRIQNEGFPASYAVFTSYMTGGPPTNFMGAPIMEDNLLYQLTNSGKQMKYVGTRMPAYDVLEQGNYFASGVTLESTTESSKLYQTLFQCELNDTKLCANQYLNSEATGRNTSIFFSGDIVDERNHMTGDKYDPITLQIIKTWIEDMGHIKQWIDDHPEYLLLVFSDHGGKLKSETAAHGRNNDGNEAFIMTYNPRIQPLPAGKQDIFIDQAGGVSLPAINIGMVKPTTSDPREVYKLLKLNADQFNRLGNRWRYRMNQGDYNRAIQLGANADASDDDLQEGIRLFTTYINGLKVPFLNLKRFPMFEVVFFPIAIGILIMALMKKQYGTWNHFYDEVKNNFALVILPYIVIFGLTALFSGFWVLYWHDDNESIHVYVASLLCALVMYYSPNASVNIKRVAGAKTPGPITMDTFPAFVETEPNVNITNGQDTPPMGGEREQLLRSVELKEKVLGGSKSSLLRSTGSFVLAPDISLDHPASVSLSVRSLSDSDELVQKNTNLAYEYKPAGQWLIKYAFFSFSMAVCQYLLTVPLEELLLVHLYKGSYMLAAMALTLELYIQRRKLAAHFVHRKPNTPRPRGFMTPLYIKFTVYYLILLGIYIYDRSWRTSQVMMPKLAFVIYLILGLHSFILMFCPRYLQADIFLPLSMMLFFLSNDKERFYLVLFVIPQFYCISNIFYFKLFNMVRPILQAYQRCQSGYYGNKKSSSHNIYMLSLQDFNFFAGITDHFLPFVVLLLASIALSCYKSMKMNFQIGDVAIYVPGVYDPPSMPVFSGFIMGFHKLGYFFLLGAFLIKFANPCPPALFVRKWFNKRFTFGFKIKSNRDYDRIVESLGIQVWGFLMLVLLCSLFFFHLGYYNFMVTKAFVFTVTISVFVIFYGVSLMTSNIGMLLYNLFQVFITKKSNEMYSSNLPYFCLPPKLK
ncbi:hypothetical protein SAMD00019534_067880 [Acytostelium subglobosum LB1]|uniref:hypothetical protein n=1 Tax=Acytostelium subglobosum LB1 TaxID=1410327 RepID=UPI000644EC99|nr:hypothetical protein SAMD00019534_067880 [Acytostelium subglobosum LB1]GAM23613.1 hypothetical protein SAMD00019534_067880 [Acytostelium subglobosum LB1]|eukprot:XP_012753354.1 hypothetical protein SAMD00019534_067880 [Acytostelium subglobosum LB1]